MKKNYLLIAFTAVSCTAAAQNIGIGTTTPNASAILEIKASTRGLLIPRTSTTSRTAIVNPAKGLMVYDTTTSSFWFYNSSAWVQIGAGGNGWTLTGNAGTNPATNFLGTTDNQPLTFKINNTKAGLLTTNGNVFWGLRSGNSNTGYSNIGIGTDALKNNTTRNNQVAIGDSALYNNGTGAVNSYDGDRNTAIGSKTLFNNTTGYYNTATGYGALTTNTSGAYNTVNGYAALYLNTTGAFNTASGVDAMYYNQTGSNNVANGYLALENNTTGNQNTATGYASLYCNIGGDYNSAHGTAALNSNTSGNWNTAIGGYAMYLNQRGYSNVAIGANALYNNINGSNLVAIGDSALFNNITGIILGSPEAGSTAVGSKALYNNNPGIDNTAIGYHSLYANTSGFNNTATGLYALTNNISGDENTAYGVGSLSFNTTGSENTALGSSAYTSPGVALFDATALGHGAIVNASNKVRIGDITITVVESAAGSWTTSDGRFKDNITEEVKGMEFIKLLRPVVYNFDAKKFEEHLMQNCPDSVKAKRMGPICKDGMEKASGIRQSGFIAQEVELAISQSGYNFNGIHRPENATDNYSLSYEKFVVPLVKAGQEQQQQIDALQEENTEIKKQLLQLGELRKEIDILKKLKN